MDFYSIMRERRSLLGVIGNFESSKIGNAKSKYGTGLLTSLAKLLRIKLGAGYSRPNLNNMRKFYLLYPICQTVSDKLSWSHICELITIDDDLESGKNGVDCYSQIGHAVTVLTWQS